MSCTTEAAVRGSVRHWVRALVRAAAICVAAAPTAAAQPAGAPLVGPARDLAREVIVEPIAFDPLLVWPLAAAAQAAIDVQPGTDAAISGHAAVRSGDDSYGIVAGVPLARAGAAAPVDREGLRRYPSLGVELINVIWRPRARRALEEQLAPDGFVRLSAETRQQVARAIDSTDAVAVPWAIYVRADYRFNRAEYDYLDAQTGALRSETRLNDTASLMGGVQFRVRARDPGYFIGIGFNYSAVFRDADAVNGAIVGGPSKVRSNLVRVEVRRPLPARRIGVSGSVAHDVSLSATTAEGVAYRMFAPPTATKVWRWYGGVRAGYRTGSAGGAFLSVFVGPSFGRW